MDNYNQASIESVLPRHIQAEYPQFVSVLRKYYEWLETVHLSGGHAHNWSSVRNIDEADDNFMGHIEEEYAPDFPKSFTTSKAKVYKNIKSVYLAKGTKRAIESYFKVVFGNEATVAFPRDNMLIASGGNWDDAESKYTDFANRLGFDYSKLQDSDVYQTYSYRIYTRPAPYKYKDNVKKLLHPAGFKMIPSTPIMQDAKDIGYAIGTLHNLDRVKFLEDEPISYWGDFTVEDVTNRVGTNIQPGLERDNT